DESHLEDAYQLLDAASREALAARAKALGAALAVELEPWEAMTVRGLVEGQRMTDAEVVASTDDRATVELRFAAAVPVEQGGPKLAPSPARVHLRREDAGWRVSLPLALPAVIR